MADDEHTSPTAWNSDSDMQVSSGKAAMPTKLSFLDLPLEVRLIIYPLVFSDAVIEVRAATPNNDRPHHWFVSKRNEAAEIAPKTFSWNRSFRPHVWRPRSQILCSCWQIRDEIISNPLYQLDLNLSVNFAYVFEKHITPFLSSCITKIATCSTSGLRVELLERFPSLRCFEDNQTLLMQLGTQVINRLKTFQVQEWETYEDKEQIAATKAGSNDARIIEWVMMKGTAELLTMEESWLDTHRFFLGRKLEHQHDFNVRVRAIVVPNLSVPPSVYGKPLDDGPGIWGKYPQLDLLITWNAESRGKITERHWRSGCGEETPWECLSADRGMCSCSVNGYISTAANTEHYCEDWFGQVIDGANREID